MPDNIYEMVADDEIESVRPAQSRQVLSLQESQRFIMRPGSVTDRPMRARSAAQSVKSSVRRAASMKERTLWKDQPEVCACRLV